ncbi:MAG: 2-C-methyl-D-erythritol 4-phosphate cytidylyltransferase [Bacteroidales bacterium]|nr:2-C-methyl-D-erythritol 4-phosphate cytidylyltransferase [Bacteroidales bacterium]
MLKNYALILAAGTGSRIMKSTPKAFLKLNNLYVLEYSILVFSSVKDIDHIILVVPKAFIEITKQFIRDKKYSKVIKVINGGESRFESSKIGISSISDLNAKVLIHDAARPFVSEKIIKDCLLKLQSNEAVNVMTPITDTVVRIDEDEITETVDRALYRQTQTPQGFDLNCIKEAHKQAEKHLHKEITDDFGLVLRYKTGRCDWVNGDSMNFKITYNDDFELAKNISLLKKIY